MQHIIKKLQTIKRSATAAARKAEKSLKSAPETGRQELILEHFGRMDEPVYKETVTQKLSTYAENGIFACPGGTLLFTTETKDAPLNVTHLENMLKTALNLA